MRRLRFNKAVLFGTGLIGASLGRDLLRSGIAASVAGIDPSRKNLGMAKKLRAITSVGGLCRSELADADLVIFASPVSAIGDLIDEYAHSIPEDALVIDVGSTKDSIVRKAAKRFKCGNFVGCHPMAGTENSGAAASVEDLFFGKTCFIVTNGADPRFVNKASALWRAVGAVPVAITAREHDRFAAAVSHLPHLAAFALMNAVAATGMGNVRKFSGGGLRDTTRIAASSPGMWRDIFLANAGVTLKALSRFKRELTRFEMALRDGDGAALAGLILKSSRARRSL